MSNLPVILYSNKGGEHMTRLLEEIKQYQSEFRQKAPAEKQRLMAEATAELAASGIAKGLDVLPGRLVSILQSRASSVRTGNQSNPRSGSDRRCN